MFDDKDFNRNFNRIAKVSLGAFVVAALVSLAIVCVIIWAIIKVVTHFL